MDVKDVQSGWYIPDLGPETDLPEDFLITMENMTELCIKADKYAEEIAHAALSLPDDEWVAK